MTRRSDGTAAEATHRPGAERRSAPRYPVNPETACRVLATDDPAFQPAEVRNISTGGLRLAVARHYEVGTFLTVELSRKGGQLERTLVVRVVHVSEQGDRFVLGCAFLAPLAGHELLALSL